MQGKEQSIIMPNMFTFLLKILCHYYFPLHCNHCKHPLTSKLEELLSVWSEVGAGQHGVLATDGSRLVRHARGRGLRGGGHVHVQVGQLVLALHRTRVLHTTILLSWRKIQHHRLVAQVTCSKLIRLAFNFKMTRLVQTNTQVQGRRFKLVYMLNKLN